MRLKLIAIAFATVAAAAVVHAQPQGQYRYRWVDTGGLAHYSDSLTADAIKSGYDIINNQGIVVRHVERTLTPQERKARELADQRAARQRREARQQALEEQQMLAAYPQESDYKSAQQALIDAIAQRIHTTQINLHSQEKNLAELLDKAADAERENKPVPKFLTDRIAERRKAVASQRALLQRQQQQQASAESAMGDKLNHYRQLRAQQQAANQDQD